MNESIPVRSNTLEYLDQKPLAEGWRVHLPQTPETPIFQKGREYLNARQDLLLALCLNNGYYNRENIYRMLKFALASSKSVQVFTTDGPARHNYRALGMPETEVVRKTRLEGNRLRNLTTKALELINAELLPEEQRTISFMDWSAIYADSAYQASVAYLNELYETNSRFRTDAQKTTDRVLSHKTGISKNNAAALSEGVHYLLEEVAFILAYRYMSSAAKPVAEHGSDGFNYLYYESWPVFERLVNGEYDGKPKEGIGFIISKIEES